MAKMNRNESQSVEEKLTGDFRKNLEDIVEGFIKNNGIEIFGNLNIEVANIDDLALIKGNTIYVNIDAKQYSEHILKYVVAHELAHLVLKRHTKRFWDIVRHIYPEYEKGKNELTEKFNDRKLNR